MSRAAATTPAPAPAPRPMCLRCDRPRPLCLCAQVPRLDNRTRVLVLQHPRERRHPLGTARLLRLGLSNAQVQVCWQLAATPQLVQRAPAALLFPHPQATPLRPQAPWQQLVVLDGTWSQARALYRANSWLQRLPHVAVAPDGVDRYRLRREPRPQYASTVEATCLALRLLEPPELDIDALMAAFTAMIDRQLPFVGRRVGRRARRRARPAVARRVALWADAEARLVVAYGEFVRPAAGPRGAAAAQLVYWTACHLGTGRCFAARRALPPDLPLTAAQTAFMGLPADGAATAAEDGPALDDAALAAAWRAFVPADPLLLVWHGRTLSLCRRFVDGGARGHLLKTLYCNRFGGAGGALEDACRRHALAPTPLPCRGRAQGRLGAAVSLARWLARQG